jgi:hypothetical protein
VRQARRHGLALAALLLAGCEREAPTPAAAPPAGAALERAGRGAGLVAAAARDRPAGVYAAEAARLCLVPRAGGEFRVGVSVDYGAGQRCLARGTARAGATLRAELGAGCTVELDEDGEALVMPATLPAACDSRCAGRASLAGVRLERLSDSVAEASRTRGADGRLLCGDG